MSGIVFFINTRDGRFADASSAHFGLDLPDDGRGVAVTDWNFGRSPRSLAQQSNRTSRTTSIEPVRAPGPVAPTAAREGTTSNRDAIGARVIVRTANPTHTLMRTVRAGDGFLSQSSKWLHFGLGTADLREVTIRWPHGEQEVIASVEAESALSMSKKEAASPKNGCLQLGHAALAWGLGALNPQVHAAEEPSATRTWILGRVPLIDDSYVSDGVARSTDQFLGQSLLINLWSKTCEPCWRELGEWTEHRDDFRSSNCAVVAISVDPLAGQESAEAKSN